MQSSTSFMSLARETRPSNRVLRSLTIDEFARISSCLRPVHLPRGRVLCEAGDLPQSVYFPLSGVVSLLSTTESGDVIEVAMVGNEGTTALPILLHSREMPYRASVQVPLVALAAGTRIFQEHASGIRRLEHLLQCYTHSLFTELAQSAVCNRFHTADQRFCRWLLSTQDRVQSDTVELTHEVISNMLGVQRSLVTVTAGNFQKTGLITYCRGTITVRDRLGLEAASCECYRIVNRPSRVCSSNCLNSKAHSSG